ncbi:hypothetical protein [Sporosarcina cyprini]|uniref:hypothetical protein n=1 Tax=Sporosarcina cyprini TaxID=2910523 RepID=UPI001EDED5CF|nr:hypothetical protein [Sporosarcina cyprini]MCG3089688.1 hypothetical protein [Sporosarcina cyprini]
MAFKHYSRNTRGIISVLAMAIIAPLVGSLFGLDLYYALGIWTGSLIVLLLNGIYLFLKKRLVKSRAESDQVDGNE